ncbi:hypothetical protein 4Roscha1_00102 [Erwinia phage Roscha1]|nr:hypothetical protein 4Roscha1_00102 [Erwinia phage Roscha1]
MGKTIRRKNLKGKEDWFQHPDRKEGHGHAVYHGDKLKRMSGISSGVKERQHEIQRQTNRQLSAKVMIGEDVIPDNTDRHSKRLSNQCYTYS